MDLGTAVMLGVLAVVVGFGLFVANNVVKTDREKQRESGHHAA
ncbi:hypothetical protein ABFG95_08045 [Achromobacter sp. HNDS-1]|uniref:Uncharacterized protein n=1 Tax=Achromobacter sp. HNDS-1 TaxID=3151598 RepID=A0AAU7LEP0_9BURK|nr:hypothetical protein [Achromobacter xylosoxidans]CUJ03882.1 Uncharacterised protein [Achromobacter xylosoxidans]CUJ18624.1 Uncharacterised protein [Achromobacter xylosoxidans]